MTDVERPLVYTVADSSSRDGDRLLAVLSNQTGVHLAVIDYWWQSGHSDRILTVIAWRLGSTVHRGVFRGDRDDWNEEGPDWPEDTL